MAVSKEKRGISMDMNKVTKFFNIVLIIALAYTYMQLAVTQTEYRMYKQYNNTSASLAGAPVLPKIQDLK